ncbi:GNAT family N-acetyltransferase [Rhizobium cauense]|uniref:GNAT family N-acetyltransferase n=1 Tax=Rhizobium cauense TaxID=1166683 RepID=UPI001CB7802E|nr:GNAT family N-acetyltransferase [Rhizobium cauense]
MMEIPDLLPDIRFPPLVASDHEFSFRVKAEAMGPHIKRHWGWDEQYQRDVHHQKLRARPFSLIELNGSAIGTVSLERHADHLQFGEFYILTEFRGQGIGSRVLRHCLSLADEMHLPVSLEYLLWNPVGTLYRRHGFLETSTTETHYILSRPTTGPGAMR